MTTNKLRIGGYGISTGGESVDFLIMMMESAEKQWLGIKREFVGFLLQDQC